MQNKCKNGESAFVSLEGSWDGCGWHCGKCGCWNDDGCRCSGCGWERCGSCPCGRCGENGRVYSRAARNSRCGGQESCSHDCGCTGVRNCTRDVLCCENNTSIRSFNSDNGCDKCSSTYTRQNRSTDCDCDKGCEKCSSAYTRQNRSTDCDCDNGCDKSGSTYTRQNRSTDCDCDKGCEKYSSSAYTRQNRSSDCGCDTCNEESAYGRRNRGVGMVWAAEQELDRIFESESALRTGTLFPELHKPLNGYCPAEGNCADACQEAAFAAWELRLYLNTHPDDKQALALFRKLCAETGDPNYATSFLDGECCTSCWDWVKDPWPWECGANGK